MSFNLPHPEFSPPELPRTFTSRQIIDAEKAERLRQAAGELGPPFWFRKVADEGERCTLEGIDGRLCTWEVKPGEVGIELGATEIIDANGNSTGIDLSPVYRRAEEIAAEDAQSQPNDQ